MSVPIVTDELLLGLTPSGDEAALAGRSLWGCAGSGLRVFQSSHQGDHLPGVAGDRSLLEADDVPAGEDLPDERLGEVVADPLRVQAGAQQEASTWAEHALNFAGVAGPVGGLEVVQAAAVQGDVEAVVVEGKLADVGLDELHGGVQVVGAAEGGAGAVDTNGERHPALREIGGLGAEPTAKVQGVLGGAEPAVVEGGDQLGWGRGGVPDLVDVGLILLVEDARGPVHAGKCAASCLPCCGRLSGGPRLPGRLWAVLADRGYDYDSIAGWSVCEVSAGDRPPGHPTWV